MDGGVLFQRCRLEVGGLLGGPSGGMVHGRCSVKLVLGTGGVIPCHEFCYYYHRFLQFLILNLHSGSLKYFLFFIKFKKNKQRKTI